MKHMRLRIACFALLVIIMIAGIVPHASAAEDIGLSVAVPYAGGENGLYLSWDSVSTAEYYCYSVRNVTTNELLVDRKQTSNTSATVKGEWIEGHEYRVWAGACCEGNDPGNTSTWDYTGQTVVTIRNCPHKKTDTSWDKNVHYKSVSDTHHEVKGHMHEYCVECFAWIGDSYEATELNEHEFDKKGNCTICDYRPTCHHDKTELVKLEGFPDYVIDDEFNHVVDIQYKKICKDCGSVVDSLVDSAREYYRESHEYNSKGECHYCDFVMPVKQEPLTLSVSVNQTNAEIGTNIGATAYAAGGNGNYSYAWIVTFNGGEVDRTDYTGRNYCSVAANQEGSYVFNAYVQDGNGNQISASSSEVVVTAPACKHPGTDIMWDTGMGMTYENVSDDVHAIHGYVYEYCTDCFERVGSSYAMTENYPHDFNDAGDCPTCGYTKTCPHVETRCVVIDGYPDYSQEDEANHIVDIQYKRICQDCNSVVEKVVDSEREYYRETHNYDSEGVCRYCDFVMPAKQKALTLSVSVNQTNAETGTNIDATAHAEGGSGNYSYAWIVTLNGGEINRTDYTSGRYYSIAANQEGSYVFTAYVRDGNGEQISASSSEIVVTAPVCSHSSKGLAWDTSLDMDYGSISDDEHSISGYAYEYCRECYGRVGENFWMTANYPHDFNDAGDCPTCGYPENYSQKGTENNNEGFHIHIYEKVETVSPYYTNLNDQEHSVITTYYTRCSCGDETDEVTEIVNSKHILDYMGYESLHPHKVFVRCACGYAEYTGSHQQMKSCLECCNPMSKDNEKDYYPPDNPDVKEENTFIEAESEYEKLDKDKLSQSFTGISDSIEKKVTFAEEAAGYNTDLNLKYTQILDHDYDYIADSVYDSTIEMWNDTDGVWDDLYRFATEFEWRKSTEELGEERVVITENLLKDMLKENCQMNEMWINVADVTAMVIDEGQNVIRTELEVLEEIAYKTQLAQATNLGQQLTAQSHHGSNGQALGAVGMAFDWVNYFVGTYNLTVQTEAEKKALALMAASNAQYEYKLRLIADYTDSAELKEACDRVIRELRDAESGSFGAANDRFLKEYEELVTDISVSVLSTVGTTVAEYVKGVATNAGDVGMANFASGTVSGLGVIGSVLAGQQLGKLATQEAAQVVDARSELVLRMQLQNTIKSALTEVLYSGNNSDALYEMTNLYLQSTHDLMGTVEQLFEGLNNSWFMQIFQHSKAVSAGELKEICVEKQKKIREDMSMINNAYIGY